MSTVFAHPTQSEAVHEPCWPRMGVYCMCEQDDGVMPVCRSG